MKRTLTYTWCAILMGVLATISSIAMAAPVNHETVLTGDVVSVVATGTAVKEGDALVTVETLAGPMVAARARVSGVVSTVNVAPGQSVTRGDIVSIVDGQ